MNLTILAGLLITLSVLTVLVLGYRAIRRQVRLHRTRSFVRAAYREHRAGAR